MERFEAIWIADGSTLEELRRKTTSLRQRSETVLAGKMMMVVELLTHRPVAVEYTDESDANNKVFCTSLLERLPVGGLLVFDLGFFKFAWFDAFTEAGKFFLTRLREKTAYRRVQVLAQGERYCDELVELGLYRSTPCHHPLRLVSVRWGTTWHQYLTNVVDPQQLRAQEVCDLYRRRWRIFVRSISPNDCWGWRTSGLAIAMGCKSNSLPPGSSMRCSMSCVRRWR